MKRDLETLRNMLWTTFEEAVGRHPEYEDRDVTASHSPTSLKILNRQAIGVLGQALVQVETEIARQKEIRTEQAVREKRQVKLG